MTQSLSPLIQAIRGMNDILPEEIPYWYLIENACRRVVKQYGYQEIRLPIVEDTALFKRTIGEDTDIVEKEMYTFVDRNGDSLTLRPEGTAGCVRACIEHRLLYKQTQRLWYLGPMFRHERPQKGRYRQFYQLGVEAYGMAGPEIDAEIIFMGTRLWRELGLSQHIELQLNSLGTREARARYREALLAFLKPRVKDLDPDSQRRLSTNPLRILDSKSPETQRVIAEAPKMLDFLDEASQSRWSRLQALLDEARLPYVINPNLVRGLDYYGETVFEWVTNALGAQGTVCAGGRYDSLVEQLGEREPTPAIGFAAGIERLVLLLRSVRTCAEASDLYLVLLGSVAEAYGLKAVEQLREALPNLSVETHLNGGSMKSQLKRADKRGARWAAIVGDEEVRSDKISLKDLRDESAQQTLRLPELIAYLKEKTND